MTTESVVQTIVTGRTIEGSSAVLRLLPLITPLIGTLSPPMSRARSTRVWRPPSTSGYANLISPDEKRRVLTITRDAAAGRRFVAGASIEGQDEDINDLYAAAVDEIQSFRRDTDLSCLKR